MRLPELEQYLLSLFDTRDHKDFHSQSGFTVRNNDAIKKIGYCTNLTMDTVEESHKQGVDLLITHHDAWKFIFGLKDACEKKLREYNISHYFNHLPLDDCDFGTNSSLLEKLGLQLIKKSHLENGFYFGRIAEFSDGIMFSELVEKMEKLLGEPVQAWQFKEGLIKRVGMVCGGGGFTPDVKMAVEEECDVYITGEKVMYTIQYAKFAKINLIIGSHTFTEIFGVESLAQKIQEEFTDVEIIRLQEEHLEVNWMEKSFILNKNGG